MFTKYRKPNANDHDSNFENYGFNINTTHYFKDFNKNLNEHYYEFLKELTDELDKNDITYMLIYGTLLGCYRHGGFIPTDDDIDIAIPSIDHEKLMNIKSDKFDIINGYLPLIECYSSVNDYLKYKKYTSMGHFAIAKKNNFKIDIFHIIPIEINKKIIGYSFSENSLHKIDDIYPLKKGLFGNHIYNVPNKSIKILNKFYDKTLDIVDEDTINILKWSSNKKNKISRFYIENSEIILTKNNIRTNLNHKHAPHVACDGCGIAHDDIKELATIQRRNELWLELFRNAARLRKAMRSNAWLRPIFRKYKRTCREILLQKQHEAAHFATLCDYCDAAGDAPSLNLVREELEHIHARIKMLEEEEDPHREDESTSSSDLSDDSDNDEDNDNNDNNNDNNNNNNDNNNEKDNDTDDNANGDDLIFSSSDDLSESSSDSSSSSSSESDMEDFY